MRNRILLLVALFALMFGGCEDEKISPQDVQQLATQVEQLADKVDGYQEATGEVIGTLRSFGIIDEDAVASIEKVGREIDRVQPQILEITKAIQEMPLGESDIANWIAVAQAANQATASFNPYVVPITTGLTLAGFIYGLYERSQAKKKAVEAEKNGKKYQAAKQGTELTMKTQPAELQKELYKNIGEARVAAGI